MALLTTKKIMTLNVRDSMVKIFLLFPGTNLAASTGETWQAVFIAVPALIRMVSQENPAPTSNMGITGGAS